MGRLHVLLTEDRERPEEHWTRQLARLLEPQGVAAHLAQTAQEALELTQTVPLHVAVVDLSTPLGREADPAASAASGGPGGPGGLWLVRVLQRQPNRPALVVVNDRPDSPRQTQRILIETMQLGVFSVINRPQRPDPLLAVIRRLLDRHYEGLWPTPPQPGPGPGPAWGERTDPTPNQL